MDTSPHFLSCREGRRDEDEEEGKRDKHATPAKSTGSTSKTCTPDPSKAAKRTHDSANKTPESAKKTDHDSAKKKKTPQSMSKASKNPATSKDTPPGSPTHKRPVPTKIRILKKSTKSSKDK